MFYADSLGFFCPPLRLVDGKPQVQPPVVDPQINLRLIHATSAPPFATTMEQVVKFHEEFEKYLIAKHESQVSVVFYASEPGLEDEILIGVTKASNSLAVVYGLQNTPDDVMETVVVSGQKEVGLNYLRGLGICILGIAYEKSNHFGSGFSTPIGGLTEDGFWLLEECVKYGMIIDLAHLNHQTARDVVWGATGNLRVMASHGGCYSVFPHQRNLPDDVLRAIADMGGVVGIATLTFILDAERNNLEPFVAHLRHAVNVCGEDAVCIGSGGYYTTEDPAEALARFEVMKKVLDTSGAFQPRYPDQPPELNTPKRMEVIEYRLTREFRAAVVEKIMGLNFLRFLGPLAVVTIYPT